MTVPYVSKTPKNLPCRFCAGLFTKLGLGAHEYRCGARYLNQVLPERRV